MVATNSGGYVLWGVYARDVRLHSPVPWIKLSGGSLRECRRDWRQRAVESGWAGLVIEPVGKHPSDPDTPQRTAAAVAVALGRSPTEPGTARLAADLGE